MSCKIKILSILLVLVVVVIDPSFAQKTESSEQSKTNVSPEHSERLVFQTIPANFEYNGVKAILKDNRGYMWFGTVEGLIRYDGINVYVYVHDPNDSTTLTSSTINALKEDDKGNLWIGTAQGLNLYDREMDRFIRVGELNEGIARLNYNYITSLDVDEEARLWISTYGDGINVYNHDEKTILHFAKNVDEDKSIDLNRISRLAIDFENKVWLGTQQGLIQYDRSSAKYINFCNKPDVPDSLCGYTITSLVNDIHGNIWIGSRGGGVHKVVKKNNDYLFKSFAGGYGYEGISSDNILSLCTSSDGCLWIGTENGGLNRIAAEFDGIDIYKEEEGNNNGLLSNSIWSLFIDDEGRLWIGTATKGISVIDKQFDKFESYQRNPFDSISLSDNDVSGFAEDDEGNVWIATDGGGICKFDTEKQRICQTITNSAETKLLSNNAAQAIVFDANKNIWVGTWAGGIDRLTKEGVRIRNYKVEGTPGAGYNSTFTIFEDQKTNIWAGTAGRGLFRFDRSEDRFERVICNNSSSIITPSAYVTSILEDREGTFWVGTLNGLASLTYQEGYGYECVDIPITNQNIGVRRSIEILFEDSSGRLWLGTLDHGLVLFNKEDYSSIEFNVKDGLPSNTIKGILEDDLGNLWISTRRGLCQFKYGSLSFTNYTQEDGLSSNEFYERASLKTKKGQFFLGGENGFDIFYPEAIRKNDYIPPVYLTNLKINNISSKIGAKDSPLKKHISETSEIVLNHKQTTFSIEFIALNYTRSTSNLYTYILEGFDNDWIFGGTKRNASYTKIPPGEYVFMVKGSNNDGVWNESPVELKIIVKPPFWETWWAILIYIFVLTALVMFFLRMWNERIYIKHQLRLEQIGREKEQELNDANIQFFTNISHEFRTPLSLILAPLERLISTTQTKIKEQLMVIYHNAQRLHYLTNNLMDFRKLEEGQTSLKVRQGEMVGFIWDVASYFDVNFKRRNISFSIDAYEDRIDAWFDPEKLETILLNLLSNASKHTPDNGRIQIQVHFLKLTDSILKYEISEEQINATPRFIEIKVIDNGSGIPSEDLPFVFEKFFQAKAPAKMNKAGTGIGLALTQGFIELSHGSIKVDSIPGEETCFSFILPINKESFRENEIETEAAIELKNRIVNKPEKLSLNLQVEETTTIAPGENDAEILIVEDNFELRNFLVKELGKKYRVLQAEDGKPGIEIAFERTPDLIVSDIIMPECTGIELCNILKADIRTSHIPIVLLTAKTTVHEQIEGVEIGADAYIAKPFNVHLLDAKIDQLIKSRRKLYAYFSQEVYFLPKAMADNEMDQIFLQKVIDYVHNNITDNTLNVEALATDMNLSRSNVYRKIKALTGKTVIEFIRVLRLKHSLKLMETKKHNLADIAYLSGFTSPSYFTKSFKDQYGKPPSEFLS